MINKDEKFVVYLDSLVNRVFKILPLYEEKNVGLVLYVESLYFELEGLNGVVSIEDYSEYTSLLATLMAIKNEVHSKKHTKAVIKREVFKSINLVKNLILRVQDGE